MKLPVTVSLLLLATVGCQDSQNGTVTVLTNEPLRGAAVEHDAGSIAQTNSTKKTVAGPDEVTPPADTEITDMIRKKIIDSKLGPDAQNVKVVTQDGRVTLGGVVKTAEQKQKIEEFAHEAAGVEQVKSYLEVDSQ